MVARIQFREEEMREAIAEFRRCSKELRDSIQQMRAISKSVDDGALVGQGGTALSGAVGRTLSASTERLAQKLEERARVMEVELEQLLQAASQLR